MKPTEDEIHENAQTRIAKIRWLDQAEKRRSMKKKVAKMKYETRNETK